jgi:hypothetical protein
MNNTSIKSPEQAKSEKVKGAEVGLSSRKPTKPNYIRAKTSTGFVCVQRFSGWRPCPDRFILWCQMRKRYHPGIMGRTDAEPEYITHYCIAQPDSIGRKRDYFVPILLSAMKLKLLTFFSHIIRRLGLALLGRVRSVKNPLYLKSQFKCNSPPS